MLPRWFNEWNAKNPTNIYAPAIVFGGIGGAVFLVIMLIAFGQPFATNSLQTGPRGTGMSVPEFKSDLAKPDPTIADFVDLDLEPIIPEGGEALAKDIYENVQVLGDLTEDNFNRVMASITNWVAPEQGCAYCHGDVDITEYGEDNLYTKVVARNMIQMTQNINENWGAHVNANKEVGVTCYTCHRGNNVPNNIWFQLGPVNESMAGWGAVQNRVTVQSQFASLPSDALEQYLLNYELIAVHDLEAHVAEYPADGIQTWQHTERTFSLMNYFSNSLGVNCVFCHNSRAFYDAEQITPQWATASLGIAMVQELNNDWLVPLQDVYPPERLGPVLADAPKAACKTCHQGYQQPLQGTNVIGNWPELAASGAPVYD